MKILVLFFSFLLFLIPHDEGEANDPVLKEASFIKGLDSAKAKNNIRRHYLIAIDVSGAFVSKSKPILESKEALITLFQNKIPHSTINENSKNLTSEIQNGIRFFDPEHDEISYYQFGITEQEIALLRPDKYSGNKDLIINNFNEKFIEDKQFKWTEYSTRPHIEQYFNTLFYKVPKQGFGEGVTLSNYVYPLVLDNIKSSYYATEYILIIVSDFLTGSQFGNKNDFLRLKDIYRYSYDYALSKGTAPNIIKEYINDLSSAFYPIDYFEYAFGTKKNNVGLMAYKIKPKAGKERPEDISMFIDGNIGLKQISHKGSDYNLSPSQLRFIHNDKIYIDALSLSVKTNIDSIKPLDFDFQVGSVNMSREWESAYTRRNTLMNLDSSSMSYTIPILKKIPLKKEKLGKVALTYMANVGYKPLKTSKQKINYTFQTTRNLALQDIQYKSKLSIIMITYLLPIALVLLILIILIIVGKPKELTLRMGTVLNDSFEEINYKKNVEGTNWGRQLIPYLRWGTNKKSQVFVLQGAVNLGSSILRGLWRNQVYIKIIQEKSAPGYEIRLRSDSDSISGNHDALKVRYSKHGDFDFNLDIEKVDALLKVNKRIKFEFVLEAFYEKSFLFFSKSLRSDFLKYSFYIGPELGNTWVGIDPGTSGSCIAAGADGHPEVFIPTTNTGEDLIIPSMLTFLKGADNNELRDALPYKDKKYFYGTLAKTNSSRKQYAPATFRSIKKLLGFADKIQLDFTENPVVSYQVDGKELCSLLAKGIYRELETAVTRANKKELLINGAFEPKRAIVAIPNNFTAQKIQDIIDSVDALNQFDEIRCIYEAEANLMYYLFGVKKITKNTTVLLFDMGGATINATIASIKGQNIGDGIFYKIDIIGKLGYGIGGDTIDYVIINFLGKYLNSLGVYVDPFNFHNDPQLKERLVDLAFSIKCEIIDNYNEGSDVLIDNIKLGSFINKAFETSVSISGEEEVMQAFTRQEEDGSYPFFKDDEVQGLLFNNVQTVVKDIMSLCPEDVDQVIFSGRSVVFPEIQKTVLKALGQSSIPEVHSLSIDELKSAVAKGACLYGMNRSRVELNSVRVNSWFGVKHSLSAHDFNLIKLIPLGASFTENGEGLKHIKKRTKVESDFGLDGGMVNFYQIMGTDPIASFRKGEKHKYNLLKQVRIDSKTEGVGLELWENDDIVCEVKEKGAKKEKKFSTLVEDHEVGDANDKHYTWIVK
ncbi:Hsp70 family protein [Flavivirga algicola]|uniref:Hsp70 family protein n=1 Tax=Flavivirga algicola TaxID=2729136 RepID=A0ABX1RWN8_9FLAO|nr:Hsp70 family protein [Flavivirga algicola]NMH87987.1 Hsp70 family protein [Flavivirga algicola]